VLVPQSPTEALTVIRAHAALEKQGSRISGASRSIWRPSSKIAPEVQRLLARLVLARSPPSTEFLDWSRYTDFRGVNRDPARQGTTAAGAPSPRTYLANQAYSRRILSSWCRGSCRPCGSRG